MTPRRHGGLNILNILLHVLACCKSLGLNDHCSVSVYYYKSFSALEFHFMGNCLWLGSIKDCPYVSHLIQDWKVAIEHITWHGRDNGLGNSFHMESIHWSSVFVEPLAIKEPRKAYFRKMCSRLRMWLTLMEMCSLSHRDLAWICITPFVACSSGTTLFFFILKREDDWCLFGQPISQLTAIFAGLQPPPRILDQCNKLRHA